MKSLIVYSTKTDNTKKLAYTIYNSLPGEKEIGASRPAHYYRNEFKVSKEIKSARVYVTSLGTYKLFLNGEKVVCFC